MTRVTVFLCTGKDCARVWRRSGEGSAKKWLKRHVEEAGLPYKLKVVETDCMDRCEHAACLCGVVGRQACFLTDLHPERGADHVLAALRSAAECGSRG
jgi:hypothetical protein